MEPASLIAIATTSYSLIVKGFQIGRDVESMSKDVGRFMGAINDIKENHNKAKSRRFGSVEEEALTTYTALKKAEQMENELRNFLIANYGLNAWNDIIRIQGKIRKERLEEKKRKQQQLEQAIELFLIILLGIMGLSVVYFFAMYLKS